MAYLIDITAQTYIPLAPHHVFGRQAEAVDTLINNPFVSKLHAAVEWTGRVWRIKNLGMNGTWINDVSLAQGEMVDLKVNDLIRFADLNNVGFKIIDLAPPVDMLWPLDFMASPHSEAPSTISPIPLSTYHLLPDAEAPELAIYYDEQERQWYSEQVNAAEELSRQPLRSGEKIKIQQAHWQFIPAQCYSPTEAGFATTPSLNDFEFLFNLSLDEETTQLELRLTTSVDLAVRSHHNVLMQLARHRAADAVKGLDEKSQGWIYAEHLATELGLDLTLLNIHIFRLRKQLADSLTTIVGLQQLFERRGGKIRFGCEKFKIYKGSTLTAQLPLAAASESNPELNTELTTE